MEHRFSGKSKVLLSGLPGCGKTSLIERLLAESNVSACGFVTREIRESGRRVGFEILALSGFRGVLAHESIDSTHRVGKYRVDVSVLDTALQAEFSRGFMPLVVIDEIGKMELHSSRFRFLVSELWRSENPVLATVMSARNPFCDRLKADKNTVLVNLSPSNRSDVFAGLSRFIESLSFVPDGKGNGS